ncbi:winged helix-turn-helix domain-containing protein, partial [Natrinema soli]
MRDRPRATQAELADRLGVSGTTISQQVNEIDWFERRAFVDRFFDREQAALEGPETEPAGDGDAADDRQRA